MTKLHKIQMEILRELAFNPDSRFTDLNISGLTSDHFTYHVKKLLELGMVEKNTDGYVLTSTGKEFACGMDTDKMEIEKQPKVTVNVIARKKVGKKEFLLIQKRLKEPYYGYQGFITGKVRFGEKILEAAARELSEEAGLDADFELRGIFHEHVYSEKGKLLEDKMFCIAFARDCRGELIEEFDSGENYWLPRSKFAKLEKKYYSEDDIFAFACESKEFYVHRDYVVEDF